MQEIEELYHTFKAIPFPVGLGGEEIEGIELILLDADCAALIDKFLSRKGILSTQDFILLKELHSDLNKVIPELDEEGLQYFKRLNSLVESTLLHAIPH